MRVSPSLSSGRLATPLCDQGAPRDDGGGAGVGGGGKGPGGCDQDLFPPLGRPPHPCLGGFGWWLDRKELAKGPACQQHWYNEQTFGFD